MNSFSDAPASGIHPAVHCDVRNCQYHQKDGSCSAGQIVVGPAYAVSNADTACSTFKPSHS